MEYKLPPLPFSPYLYMEWISEAEKKTRTMYSDEQMRQYAEQAVAPLLAEIERLEKEKEALAKAYVGMYRAK